MSDVLLEKNSGSLAITNATVASGTTIVGQVGHMNINNLIVDGDFSIKDIQGNVTLRESNFNFKDVSVLLFSGHEYSK